MSLTAAAQAVFRVERQQDPSVVWLKENPAPKRERVVGPTWLSEADPDLLKFFSKSSVRADRLVHRRYSRIQTTYRVGRNEVGSLIPEEVADRLLLPEDAKVAIDERRQGGKFAFIYRARYRA